MTRPQPRSVMPSTTCLLMLNRLSRLVRSTASQLTLSIFLKVMSRVIPALLTSTSTSPTFSRTSATALVHDSRSATSQGTARMSCPLAFMSATHSACFVFPGEYVTATR